MSMKIKTTVERKTVKVKDVVPGETYQLVSFDGDRLKSDKNQIDDVFIAVKLGMNLFLVNLKDGSTIDNTCYIGRFIPINLVVTNDA